MAGERTEDGPLRIIVMGAAGCGKSTIGRGVAEALGAAYIEGDDLHPPANIAKMSGGTPLDDGDRAPWLDAVGAALGAVEGPAVATCSALKRAYRARLVAACGAPIRFVHLAGARAVIKARMGARDGHFMPTSLLDSQFAALEPPSAEEGGLTVDVAQPAEALIADVLARLRG